MIILGLILLIIGFIAKIAIVWTIGIIVLVIGLVFVLLGAVGRGVGGRRHYRRPRADGPGTGRRAGPVPRGPPGGHRPGSRKAAPHAAASG